mmetsp:Transcript_23685/g.93930  ORF Transcript_23685/g.93930 Transcript_23685/m.93930 type:complete len:193 (-) Transcript_23685:1106-1684(-)
MLLTRQRRVATWSAALGALWTTAVALAPPPTGVTYRRGVAGDAPTIRWRLARELMNPLGIDPDNFEVATTANAQEDIVGFGQIRDLDATRAELASLYVAPAARGAGIASTLVERLLRRYDDGGRDRAAIFLLTLQDTVPFYDRLGFGEVALGDVPESMAFEVLAGRAVTSLIGKRLTCMQYGVSRSPSSSDR